MAAMLSSNGPLGGASWRCRHQSEISRTLLENCCFSSLESFRKMQGGSGGWDRRIGEGHWKTATTGWWSEMV